MFQDITIGLFIRECRQKFGKYRLGMFWAIFEPMIHVVTFTILLGRSQLGLSTALTIPYFVLSGLIPFLLFRSGTKSILTAAKTNKSAFTYQIIKPIHSVASKMLFEFFVYLSSFVIIYSLTWCFLASPPVMLDAIKAAGAIVGIIGLSVGLGMTLMVAREFASSTEKTVNLLFRPMYFLSGIFYSVSSIPSEYHFIFAWNPVFHCVELLREAVYGTEAVYGSFAYIGICQLAMLCTGFYFYNRHSDKLKRK